MNRKELAELFVKLFPEFHVDENWYKHDEIAFYIKPRFTITLPVTTVEKFIKLKESSVLKTFYRVHYFINRIGYWMSLDENELDILLELRDIESITVVNICEKVSSITNIGQFVENVKNHRPLEEGKTK